jgi:hypothetical protein
MSKYPVIRSRDSLMERDEDHVVEVNRKHIQPSPIGFFSFTYSYRQVSNVGGKIHVKSRESRYRNGELESEEFEGTMEQGPSFYDLQREIQGQLLQHMTSYLKWLSLFLPLPMKDKEK